ncbi:hypothetical protein HBI06_091500 [Parastagonospora nodorum]|nr:hypothetical protein HBI06_091500 [Parastagonospora nodorum]KAH4249303.1 hypothetical protein HBI05_003460 [Parastagonospora nodorum]
MLDNLSLIQVLSVAILLVFARWVVRGIYRVYFHPLRKFPGPKFSAFTRIPHLKAVGSGRVQQYTAEIHEKFGDVVRISPDELSFTSPQAWRDIYGYGAREGAGHAPPKNLHRYNSNVNGVPSLVTTEDNAEHARKRKIFSPAFSDRALTAQAPLFLRYADQLVRLLKEGAEQGTKLDMVRWYNFTTFDVMGDLTFGEPLHMLDNAAYDPWVQAIFGGVKSNTQFSVIRNSYPTLARIVTAMLHKTIKAKQMTHFNHSATRVTKRLEKGRDSEGTDIWDLVLQQEEKGKTGLTRGDMDSNAELFMIAGTETTATTLSGLTYLLTQHPESMKKLADEVRGTFDSSDAISMEKIAHLPYLNACLKESLRRYPPVPVGMPHLTPSDGSTICGQFVPPGTTVSAPHWAVYNSASNFKDPQKFIPERWLDDERFVNDQKTAFHPFSYGPRDCLGKNMAWHEMRLLLSKVVYNFDFELCPESEGWTDQEVYTLWEKRPLMVKLKAVN